MNSFRYYLAGGMSNLSHEEMLNWREVVIDKIENVTSMADTAMYPVYFNPVEYYNPFEDFHKNEREPFEYDLYNLRKSDLVIVNFNSPNSIGTAMEVAIARENRIPIVGLNENDYDLHPWIVESCVRICDTMDELVNYVTDYFLY